MEQIHRKISSFFNFSNVNAIKIAKRRRVPFFLLGYIISIPQNYKTNSSRFKKKNQKYISNDDLKALKHLQPISH